MPAEGFRQLCMHSDASSRRELGRPSLPQQLANVSVDSTYHRIRCICVAFTLVCNAVVHDACCVKAASVHMALHHECMEGHGDYLPAPDERTLFACRATRLIPVGVASSAEASQTNMSNRCRSSNASGIMRHAIIEAPYPDCCVS